MSSSLGHCCIILADKRSLHAMHESREERGSVGADVPGSGARAACNGVQSWLPAEEAGPQTLP